jgi:hypothetical protein
MNKKVTFFASILMLSSLSFAASTTTTTTIASTDTNTSVQAARKSALQTLKDSNLGLSYYNVSSNRDAGKKLNGVNSTHYLYMNYKLDNSRITVRPGFTTSSFGGADSDTSPEYAGTDLRYYRYSVLTEEAHGINFMWQSRNFIYNSDSRENGRRSSHTLLGSFNKNFGKFNVSSSQYINWKNNEKDSELSDGYYLGTLGVTYKFTDKFYTAFSNTFYNVITGNDTETLNDVTVSMEPELGYTFSNGISISTSYDVSMWKKAGGSADYERVSDPLKKGRIYGTLWYTFF